MCFYFTFPILSGMMCCVFRSNSVDFFLTICVFVLLGQTEGGNTWSNGRKWNTIFAHGKQKKSAKIFPTSWNK